MKIDLDKYYTSKETALYCINKTIELTNSTSFIEPSAGNGSFSHQLNQSISKAYDIAPECDSVIKQDFLKLNISYKENRCVIGNPPFGSRMSTAQKFFKKSIEIADYISFILPISQLQNTNSLYEFNLIYSEDLGKIKYSDRTIHCCFNIYERPKNGLNKKQNPKLECVKFVRQDSKKYKDFDFDIRMCYWGNGSAGKILSDGQSYSAEYKIKVKEEFRDEVIEVLNKVNWFNELNCVAMLKIQQFHIINVLKKYIPNIY